jgi:O-antigen ligase
VGFILTVIYVFLTIISPQQFGLRWENLHILQYLAAFIFLLSMTSTSIYKQLRTSLQIFLLLGLFGAMAASEVANGWLGGIVVSWQTFMPSAAVFFFIVLYATTTRRLKILTLAVVAACLVLVVEALCGYYGAYQGEAFVLKQDLSSPDGFANQIVRIRGLSFLNDPNDLAQILLIALPLVFIAWRRGRVVANALMVLAPSALLLWAIFLTHSRGALIALAVLGVMVARKNMGTAASIFFTGLAILALFALNFTGGRGISAVDGADRLSAWSAGLEMFKSAPFFGVGFGKFTDLNDITAHNSFVLCLAELGLLGSTLWVALQVTTVMGLHKIITLDQESQAEPALGPNMEREELATSLEAPLSPCDSLTATAVATATPGDIQTSTEFEFHPPVPKQWLVVMRLAMISSLTTCWFLSRTYEITMYLILGLSTATLALQRNGAHSPVRNRWVFPTVAVEVVTIMVIYLMVRVRF